MEGWWLMNLQCFSFSFNLYPDKLDPSLLNKAKLLNFVLVSKMKFKETVSIYSLIDFLTEVLELSIPAKTFSLFVTVKIFWLIC